MAPENHPIHPMHHIKAHMHQLIEELRDAVGRVAAPKSQALFETSAEVLIGLVKAFEDHENKNEDAWRT